MFFAEIVRFLHLGALMRRPMPVITEPLQRMGIIPPPSWPACVGLIEWLRCNTEEEIERRRMLVREAQAKFIGKPVRQLGQVQRTGTVRYICKRNRIDVSKTKNPLFAHPLDAMVKFPYLKQSIPVALSALEIIEE